MAWREIEPDVFYPDAGPVGITAADLQPLVAAAKSSPRRRARLCAHPDAKDALHEMVICLARDGYVRPHRHSTPESAMMIQGSCDLVLFDDQGIVADVKSLGDPASSKTFFVRLSQPTFHTYLLRTEFILFLETTPGPFDRERTDFAPWAPAGLAESQAYLQDLESRVVAWKRTEER